jgi:hypothetical protein
MRRHELHYCKAKKEKDILYEKIEDVIIEMTKLKEDNAALMVLKEDNAVLKEDYVMLKQDYLSLKKDYMSLQKSISIGNTNSNNTNSNNIIINNFGNENTKYLKGNLIKQLANKPFTCIPNLVKLTHFNKDHPENHNIRFRNKKHRLGEVYKDAQWQFEQKNILIDKLFSKSYKTIEEYVKEENNNIDKKTMKNIDRIEINWINKDTEICKSIEMGVLNGTKDCKV